MSAPGWTHGYDLNFLKDIAGLFKADYKPHSYGAFGIPKERDVATALKEKSLAWSTCPYTKKPTAALIFRKVKTGSKQADFSQRSIAIRRGDIQIRNISGEASALDQLLRKFLVKVGSAPVWLEVHEEHRHHKVLPGELGFRLAATKIAASSDIKSLYFNGSSVSTRISSPLHPADLPALKRLEIDPPAELIEQALEEIKAFGPRWHQHYSTYNKRKSWTAIAIRGYDPGNPGFIIKPSEMSKDWKSKNPGLLRSVCQDTTAAASLPSVVKLSSLIPGSPQRIRLMKLSKGNGELSRHADITDREAGTAAGKISRFHIPLQTTEDCQFFGWNLDGSRERHHFPVGSSFYLDIRKPHAVKNNGTVERVHLVIDVACNQKTRSLIE